MKNINLLLLLLMVTISTMAMEQPSATELFNARLEYRKKRALACPSVYIGAARTESEREQILESAMQVAQQKFSESAQLTSESAFWAKIYGMISLFSCGMIITGWQNNLDCIQFSSACMLCGIAIFSGCTSCAHVCDLCKRDAVRKACKKKFREYLDVQRSRPLQLVIKRYDD